MASVADMLQEMDDHGFGDTSLQRKMAFINDAARDALGRLPWRFRTKSTTFDTAGSAGPISTPSDFGPVLALTDTQGAYQLQPMRLDDIHKNYPGNMTDSGDPFAYYFIGGQLYLYPVPGTSTGGRYRLDYLAQQPTVNGTGTATTSYAGSDPESAFLMPPRHHEIIIRGALYRAYNMEDDTDLAQVQSAEYERLLQNAMADMEMQQYDRPDTIEVVDDSEWWYT